MSRGTNGNVNLRRLTGTQHPNGKINGYPGEIYQCSDGTFWWKESGLDNGRPTKTGWQQVGAGGGGSIGVVEFNAEDGKSDYVFDGTVNTENPNGVDLRNADVINLFTDGQRKVLGVDGLAWDKTLGVITLPDILADVPVAINYSN